MKSLQLLKAAFMQLATSGLILVLLAGQARAETETETGHGADEEHDDGGHIELTEQQLQYSNIVLAPATPGTIREVSPAYGVIAANTERAQTVRARFDGVIRDVRKRIGDIVAKGDVLLTVEANESLKTYSISAAINGVVTERNANVGDQTADSILFVVQDLSTVWAELSIFPRDLAKVYVGQKVTVHNLDSTRSATGTVIYVSATGDVANQATTARVLMDNPEGHWRPGHFINAEITLAEVAAPVVVRNEALQLVADQTVIFVKGEDGFEPRPVILGRSDGEFSEVLAGLSPNETYVSQNSFVLKSELGKEDAEHGH